MLPASENCVACGRRIDSSFCPACGERRASERVNSVPEFMREHVLEAIANFDGRVLRTLKLLFLKPGMLTREFMRGVRLRYVPPLQAFLLANLAFFIWSSAAHFQILDTPFSLHMRMSYRETASAMVAERLEKTHEDSASFIKRFDVVGNSQARSLVVVMVPMFAVAVGVLTLGLARYAVQHLVYSLHTYTFLLLWLPISLYLALAIVRGIWLPLHLPYKGNDDTLMTVVIGGGTGTYVALSLQRAYGMRPLRATLTAFAAVIMMFLVFQQYRRLLFFATMYSM